MANGFAHKKSFIYFCESWQREDSIFWCSLWGLKSCSWGKNRAAPCVHLHKIGSRQKSLETTYDFLSDHIIIMTVVQKRLKIVRLEIVYRILLKISAMKELTTSLYLINDSAMLHPLKWSVNPHWLQLNLSKHVNGACIWWFLRLCYKFRPEFMTTFNVLEYDAETLKSRQLVAKGLTKPF